eukprot:s1243_g6.t1
MFDLHRVTLNSAGLAQDARFTLSACVFGKTPTRRTFREFRGRKTLQSAPYLPRSHVAQHDSADSCPPQSVSRMGRLAAHDLYDSDSEGTTAEDLRGGSSPTGSNDLPTSRKADEEVPVTEVAGAAGCAAVLLDCSPKKADEEVPVTEVAVAGAARCAAVLLDLSGHCRTSSASSRSQWALPDFIRELQIPVGTAGLQP